MFYDFMTTKQMKDWFVLKALPFLTAKTDKDIENLFIDLVVYSQEVTRTLSKVLSGPGKRHGLELESDEPEKTRSELAECFANSGFINMVKSSRDFLLRVLSVPFSEEETGDSELEERIRRSIKSDYVVVWRQKNNAYVSEKGVEYSQKGNQYLVELERVILKHILFLFKSQNPFHKQPEDENLLDPEAALLYSQMTQRLQRMLSLMPKTEGESLLDSFLCYGPGFEKVGKCPNCGVFFEKKRKDQEYCSRHCKSVVSMRRQYSKKKEKNS